ncbi:MAG: Trk system potassium transporter TrkA [Puniceicoccales bacterium]|jgi:trk system potassium uptake protein TrkA|nr:Trk system potassium transporter TrkA [Puniceicoccales bacterium]
MGKFCIEEGVFLGHTISMRAVVIGGGDVGSYLCRRLAELKHRVALIELDPVIEQQLDRELNVAVQCADGSSARVLHEHRIGDVDYFFSMTSNDHVNILAASIAKRMGAKNSIARIHDSTYSDYSHINFQAHFSIDLFTNPEALAAEEIAKSIRHPGRIAVEHFAKGEIEVQQMRVSPHSPHVGKSLQQIRLPDGLRIAYITHGNSNIVPSRETVIDSHCIVTLVGTSHLINAARQKFKPETRTLLQKITIFGNGEVANTLLKSLSSPRFRIKFCCSDPLQCRNIAEKYRNVSVFFGKATSRQFMEEENVASSDHFIACSRSDEDNVMACLQANKLRIPRCHLALNSGNYEDIIRDLRDDLRLETVISPRNATADELLRFICPDPVIELASLPNRSANFYEVRIGGNCASRGRLIEEIDMPSGCIIVALLHKFRAKVPCAKDRILAGDRLIVVANPNQKNEFISVLIGT